MKLKETIKINEKQTVNTFENTPFAVMEENNKFLIILGRQQAARETYETLKEAYERIEKIDIDLIFSIMHTVMNQLTNKDNG